MKENTMAKNPKVDDFMNKLRNPLIAEMEAVREIILAVSDKVTEDIKWSAPSYFYKDNICTFNPRGKNYVTLIFHKGALINDKTGLLEGDSKAARTARFYDMADVKRKKKNLETVIKGWIKAMDK
jgi:uncharacterized protein YdeI (YjbR/CyaY-like superfamily)